MFAPCQGTVLRWISGHVREPLPTVITQPAATPALPRSSRSPSTTGPERSSGSHPQSRNSCRCVGSPGPRGGNHTSWACSTSCETLSICRYWSHSTRLDAETGRHTPRCCGTTRIGTWSGRTCSARLFHSYRWGSTGDQRARYSGHSGTLHYNNLRVCRSKARGIDHVVGAFFTSR